MIAYKRYSVTISVFFSRYGKNGKLKGKILQLKHKRDIRLSSRTKPIDRCRELSIFQLLKPSPKLLWRNSWLDFAHEERPFRRESLQASRATSGRVNIVLRQRRIGTANNYHPRNSLAPRHPMDHFSRG